MLKFFVSIKTYLWVTGIGMAVFLAGSLYIPKNLAVFSGINDMPLMQWLSMNNNVFDRLYWIYVLVGIMLLVWLSTLICSLDAVIRRTTRASFVRVLSPQILHIGIFLVILGHGISALTGYKHDVAMNSVDTYEARGFTMKVNDIQFFRKPGENSTRWRVRLDIDNAVHTIEVGRPAFYNNVGFFAKSAQEKKKTAIIGLIYDPGVIWEIAGALVFVIGAAGVFYIKIREKMPLGTS